MNKNKTYDAILCAIWQFSPYSFEKIAYRIEIVFVTAACFFKNKSPTFLQPLPEWKRCAFRRIPWDNLKVRSVIFAFPACQEMGRISHDR